MYMYIYVCLCMYVCRCKCVCVYMYVCVCVCVCLCMCQNQFGCYFSGAVRLVFEVGFLPGTWDFLIRPARMPMEVLFLSPQHWDYKHTFRCLAFYVRFEVLRFM